MTLEDENRLVTEEIPQDVIDAARLLDVWTKQHGYEKWCLGGVCSRSYEQENKMLHNTLKEIIRISQIWKS